MSDLAQWIAAARETVGKATPGPWEEGGPWPSISVIRQIFAGSRCGPDGGEPPEYDMVCSVWQGVDCTGRMLPEHPDRDRLLADAKTIVLAVNALLALLDVAEKAEEVNAVSLALQAWTPAKEDLASLLHRKALSEVALTAALARLAEVKP